MTFDSFLFSTDTKQDTLQIYQFYVARFQIEFIFRDAKGFTGLVDCQSRDARRLNYHFNASLTALNLAKLQDNELQKKEPCRVQKYDYDYQDELTEEMTDMKNSLIELMNNTV